MIALLGSLPHGSYDSPDLPGLVETSSNLAIVTTTKSISNPTSQRTPASGPA